MTVLGLINKLTVTSCRHFIYASCSGRHVVGQGNVNILFCSSYSEIADLALAVSFS